MESWCFGTGRGWHGRVGGHGLAVMSYWEGLTEAGRWHGRAWVARGDRADFLVGHDWNFVGWAFGLFLWVLCLGMSLSGGSLAKMVA